MDWFQNLGPNSVSKKFMITMEINSCMVGGVYPCKRRYERVEGFDMVTIFDGLTKVHAYMTKNGKILSSWLGGA